ncbi:GNAT family N-acetyltransferase [Stappia sp.]|uniref:GNAT family N-acetyltransferase n=1 Tax=Stappia sp. TaxID=1870903 RepID=UPI0025EFAB44|nr:GNAT family N-acetyltransferase [Stappia sp.]
MVTNSDDDTTPDPETNFRLKALASLSGISRKDWDALANPGWSLGHGGRLERAPTLESVSQETESTSQENDFNPFICHDFLSILEESGCVGPQAGWIPQHLVLEDPDERPVAALPCYLKTNSQGEYVFDHAWADAYERAGGSYYPKLQCSVPFTPATGRRFLTGARVDRRAAIGALLGGATALCQMREASSVHITFMNEAEWEAAGDEGFLQRMDQQFHWLNHGYADFDAFLGDLASRKRKQIRKERREALPADIEIEWVTGPDLTEAHWDAFFEFYQDTGSRKWGRPYLNRAFFSLLGERLGERVLLVMAKREGRYIAGALNLIGSHTLFGRNWGCIEDHPFLHFEVCYYQAIDFAIARGLSRVEAGAQGAHKLARGYLPTPTWSAHYIDHPGFARAVADYLEEERAMVARENEVIRTEMSPFRKT